MYITTMWYIECQKFSFFCLLCVSQLTVSVRVFKLDYASARLHRRNCSVSESSVDEHSASFQRIQEGFCALRCVIYPFSKLCF